MSLITIRYNEVKANFTSAFYHVDTTLGLNGSDITSEESNFDTLDSAVTTKVTTYSTEVVQKLGIRGGSTQIFTDNNDVDDLSTKMSAVFDNIKEGVIYDAIDITLDNIIALPGGTNQGDLDAVTAILTSRISNTSSGLTDIFTDTDTFQTLEQRFLKYFGFTSSVVGLGEAHYNTIREGVEMSGLADSDIFVVATEIDLALNTLNNGNTLTEVLEIAKGNLDSGLGITASFNAIVTSVESNVLYTLAY